MASAGMPSQADVGALIRTVRGQGLLNKQLQSICTLNGLKISGVKLDLQKRIIEYANKSASNPMQFQSLKQSVQATQKAGKNGLSLAYNGHLPAPAAPALGHASRTMSPYGMDSSNLSASRPGHQTGGASPYGTPQGPHSSTKQQKMPVPGHRSVSKLNKTGLQFTSSPFYRVEEFICEVRALEEMQHHRNTIEFSIRSQEHPRLDRCGPESNLRVMLLCAASAHGVQNIAFPQNSELKVNGGDLKANMRGLKNKPGSTRPVDLTRQLRLKTPHHNNRVTFTYALTTQARGKFQSLSKQKYHLAICICRVTAVDELAKTLEASNKIPKEFTITDLRKKAADPDIVATSQKLSLKCPISCTRLQLPCRSKKCKHLQCFDATSYLQLQEQGPQWQCPICNNEAPYDSLAVDMYVKEILGNTSDDLEQVTIEPDGRWHVGKDTPSERPGPPSGQHSFSFGDDDDDDVIAISDDKDFLTPFAPFTPTRSTLGTPSFAASRESSSIPKPSTAGTKRPAQVIDLTLDSDDDEAPRPIKRQNTGFKPGTFY